LQKAALVDSPLDLSRRRLQDHNFSSCLARCIPVLPAAPIRRADSTGFGRWVEATLRRTPMTQIAADQVQLARQGGVRQATVDHAMILLDDATPKPDGIFGKDRVVLPRDADVIFF
jgi:hypothetical protein